MRDFLEFNANEYATCTISWKIKNMKVELRRKFTAQNFYMKKKTSFHAGKLTAWFKGYNRKKWGSNENREEKSRNYRYGAETSKIEIEEEESMKHGVGLLSLLLHKFHEPLLKYKDIQINET